MKTKSVKLFFLIGGLLLLGACAPKITGTWQVSRYETYAPGKQGVILSNLGTMRFDRKGAGEQHLSYTVLGISREEKLPFRWRRKGRKTVIIEGNYSEFARSWNITQNKKNFQKWETSEGERTQRLELTK